MLGKGTPWSKSRLLVKPLSTVLLKRQCVYLTWATSGWTAQLNTLRTTNCIRLPVCQLSSHDISATAIIIVYKNGGATIDST
jgi:hypothetical protein